MVETASYIMKSRWWEYAIICNIHKTTHYINKDIHQVSIIDVGPLARFHVNCICNNLRLPQQTKILCDRVNISSSLSSLNVCML